MTKQSICRACLENTPEMEYTPLWKPFRDFTIAHLLTSLTNIEITDQDNLPNKICLICLQELARILDFIHKIRESDKHLKSLQETIKVPVKEDVLELLNIKTELKPVTFDGESLDRQYDVSNDIFTYEDQNDYQNEQTIYTVEGEGLEISNIKSELKSESESKLIDEHDVNNDIEDQNKDTSSLTATLSKEKNVQCHDCNEIFKSKCKLRVHWNKVHKPESIMCKVCKKIFSSLLLLKNHSQKQCVNVKYISIEGIGRKRKFSCKHCHYSTKQYSYIKKHIITHTKEKRYSCEICGKKFSQLGSLQSHKEMAHNLIKVEMTCAHCGRYVKGRSKCYKHLKTHLDKRYQCDICKAFLKGKAGLRVHIKRHLFGKKIIPATCEICGKVYSSLTGLKTHKTMVHKINASIFKCKVCNYENKKKSVIKSHEKKHFQADQFKCSDCHRFYDSQERVAAHFQLVHGPKTHQCLFCERGFNNRLTVLKHQEKNHLEKLETHVGPTYIIVRSTYTKKLKKNIKLS